MSFHFLDNLYIYLRLYFWQLRLLRSCGQLLFDPQQIINRIQDGVLPLDVISKTKNRFGRAGIECSERLDRGFIARDNRKALLQLRPRPGEELDRIDPRELARGDDEPLGLVGGGHLEREDVCARHIANVDAQRRRARDSIVPTDGTTWLTVDERVDVPVRACRGRAVDLASAERAVDVGWVDRGQVQLWVGALVVAHGEICENL